MSVPVAEIAGWTSRALFMSNADDQQAFAGVIAGAPTDNASGWSVARWQQASGGQPARIMELYGGDRDSYYEAIANDPNYTQGWSGDPAQSSFKSEYDSSQSSMKRAHYSEAFLWLNHAVAALDALRAARIHNLPLQRNLDLRLKSSWKGGKPSLRAAIVRQF